MIDKKSCTTKWEGNVTNLMPVDLVHSNKMIDIKKSLITKWEGNKFDASRSRA